MQKPNRAFQIAVVLLMAVGLSMVMIPTGVQAQNPPPLPDISLFPEPTGHYLVGRTRFHWIDESRDELNTDEEDYRELMVTIWYPADVEDDALLAPYRDDLNGPSVEEVLDQYGIPDMSDPLIKALIELRTYAYQDAPISDSESSYPVLIFSHGTGAVPEDFSLQLVELASHGYIVVGVNHAFFSGASAYPDGRVVGSIRFGLESVRIQAEQTGAEDVLFVIDQLELLNSDDANFAGYFDLEQIGAFGHSLGGAIAVLAGSMDSRIQAVVNEDAYIMPESYPAIEQPFMFFSAGTADFPAQGPKYVVVVNGFEHGSFGDFVAYGPGLGSIDGERSVEIVRTFLLDFFDKYLRGEPSELLDGSSDDYPEVAIEASNTE